MSLSEFTDGFIAAALWSSTYEHDDCDDCREGQCNPNCDDGEHELSDAARKQLESYAREFYTLHSELMTTDNCSYRKCSPEEYAGHDYWLTSQGHGAGFWDGDWKEPAATVLTNASKTLGEIYFYVDENDELSIG